LFIMTSLGVVFAISRYTTHRQIKNEKIQSGENSSQKIWQRGKVPR
jgi:hypothetical protein